MKNFKTPHKKTNFVPDFKKIKGLSNVLKQKSTENKIQRNLIIDKLSISAKFK